MAEQAETAQDSQLLSEAKNWLVENELLEWRQCALCSKRYRDIEAIGSWPDVFHPVAANNMYKRGRFFKAGAYDCCGVNAWSGRDYGCTPTDHVPVIETYVKETPDERSGRVRPIIHRKTSVEMWTPADNIEIPLGIAEQVLTLIAGFRAKLQISAVIRRDALKMDEERGMLIIQRYDQLNARSRQSRGQAFTPSGFLRYTESVTPADSKRSFFVVDIQKAIVVAAEDHKRLLQELQAQEEYHLRRAAQLLQR